MSVSHNHSHDTSQSGGETKNIVLAFWLNTFFALFEIAGGLYANSVAIISDAVHDLGDSLSLGVAYYFQKKSKNKRDSKFSYGYKRFSLIGAFITSVVLFTGSVLVIIESIRRFSNPEQPDAKGMFFFSLFGIIVNTIAMIRLRKGSSMNERIVSLHFLEDVLGWIAVLIGSVLMMFVNIPILDPILSLIIAIYILYNVFHNLRSVIHIILQGTPLNIPETIVLEYLSKIKEIKSIHDLHIWTMDGEYHILTVHIVVNSDLTIDESERIKKEIRKHLELLKIHHSTIEIETPKTNCELENC